MHSLSILCAQDEVPVLWVSWLADSELLLRWERQLLAGGVDSWSVETGPMSSLESAPEQEKKSHKFPVNGPDLMFWSQSPIEADLVWMVTLLSTVFKTEAL